MAAPSVNRVVPLSDLGETDAVDTVGVKHLLRGLFYLQSGRPAAAIPHLRLALAYTPHSAFVHEKLSQAWNRTGDFERAAEVLERGLRENPDEPHLNGMGGRIAISEQRYSVAVPYLERAVREDAVLSQAGPDLVDALLWQGEGDRAVAEGEALIARSAGDVRLPLGVAERFEDHGRLSAARDAYRKARIRSPQDQRAALGEARVLALGGQPEVAADRLIPLFSYYPDQVELYVLIYRLYDRAGRPEATSYRDEALRLAAGDPMRQAAVANGDLLRGRVERAIQLLRRVVTSHPRDLDLRGFLAEVLLRNQDAAGCAELLNVSTAADNARLRQLRARCLALTGRVDDALTEIESTLRAGGADGPALSDAVRLLAQTLPGDAAQQKLADLLVRVGGQIGLADVLMARSLLADSLGQKEEALELLRQIPDPLPADPELIVRLADLQARNGQLPAAMTALAGLLRRQPEDPMVLNAMGFLLVDANHRLRSAEVWLRRAHRLAPDDGYVVDSLGWLFYRRGEYGRAVTALERASRLSPGDPEILRHLGDTYRAQHRWPAAEAVYRKALRFRPVPAVRQLIERRMSEMRK